MSEASHEDLANSTAVDTRPGIPSGVRRPRLARVSVRPDIAGTLILDELGSGGASVVYRAMGSFGDPRAIKVVTARRLKTVRRFRAEVAASVRVRHPNLVRVLEHGVTGAGDLYLAMELLDGCDLGRRIERGPLPIAAVVDYGLQAAAGLGALHAHGLVHRDVKPANLFLCSDGIIKILDLGLVVPFGDTEATRLTSMNCIAGTVGYMAPEQIKCERDEDALTDVWGLGATLYHALAGTTPFPARNVGLQLQRVVESAPDPLPPTVPVSLAQIVLRAIEKDRARRWPSMADFARALSEL